NVLMGKVTKVNGQSCQVDVDGFMVEANAINIAGVGEASTLSLRPERVELNPDPNEFPNIFEGEVEELIYLGDHIRTRMNVCGHEEFVVKVPNSAAHAKLREGETVKVGWKMEDCRALDA
ncbi:MAG: TOBE domain-containing protein, partial [Arenicellales bacterium]|nr:TOBE domain-containing protein [Arenicellales bacterium]